MAPITWEFSRSSVRRNKWIASPVINLLLKVSFFVSFIWVFNLVGKGQDYDSFLPDFLSKNSCQRSDGHLVRFGKSMDVHPAAVDHEIKPMLFDVSKVQVFILDSAILKSWRIPHKYLDLRNNSTIRGDSVRAASKSFSTFPRDWFSDKCIYKARFTDSSFTGYQNGKFLSGFVRQPAQNRFLQTSRIGIGQLRLFVVYCG